MDATPQPTWPQPAPTPEPAPARPVSSNRTPAAATLVAVALVGALVGFGGSQALNNSSLAKSLAGVSTMLNGGAPTAASAPVVTTSTSGTGGSAAAAPAGASSSTNPAQANPGQANPAPARNRAPGGTRGQSGSTAPSGNQAPSGSRAPSGSQAPSGNQAPAAQAPAANQAAPAGQPASSQDQAAIQQAVQAIDNAQVQAVSSNDLSGLSANSTADFANQQQSVTQDLLDNGVTEIKLDNVEWGPVTVNGTTASATAFETWTTTYSDSTTDQSRDRNVYTLVQQNGNWVVQADEHPDAEAAFPGGAQSMPGVPNNLLPPGFPNPFGNQGRGGQAGSGATSPSVQVQP